jgi:hypothetical protein
MHAEDRQLERQILHFVDHALCSGGVISKFIHDEIGCVAGGGDLRAMFVRQRRDRAATRRVTARASATVRQGRVPTSTMLWCSSGLITARRSGRALVSG